jgi:hypothetical protein
LKKWSREEKNDTKANLHITTYTTTDRHQSDKQKRSFVLVQRISNKKLSFIDNVSL